MTILHKFKLLPILVMVAFLSLSIRTMDFISGASFDAAMAEQPKEVNKQPPPMEDEDSDYSEYFETPVDDDEEEVSKGPEGPETPSVNWRDSTDLSVDNSDIRMELFNDLQKRRKKLDRKQRDLMRREALLTASEKEIDRKFEELTTIKAELNELLNSQSKEEEYRIKRLVKVYENMKPKDAARIFDTLDIKILVDVTSRMSERKLSPVMAQMNPERAKVITIAMAEQKSLPELP